MKILRRLQYLLHQRRLERELAEEMEFHRAMSGDPRAMGNMTLAREDARQVWIAAWIESVFQDLRYAARSLRGQPGFAAMALLALVLGIGLNTSLFTFYNAAALRPWPVRDPAQVVTLYAFSPREQRYGGFAAAEYRYLRDHSTTLAGAILERSENVTLDASSDVRAHFVSGNYFSVLGVDMASGRGFSFDEDRIEQPQAVAVLSHAAWKTRYGGAAGMVGRQIHINDIPFTVVGVSGEDFIGTGTESYDLWLPLAALPVARANDQMARALLTDPHWCCARMAGRLAPGVTRDQAGAELSTLAGQFGKSLGDAPHSVAVAGTSTATSVSSESQ